MTKIVLVPMHYENLFSIDSLKGIIEYYKPKIIGIEETQKDTNNMLRRARSEDYVFEILDGRLYKDASLFADQKTVISIAECEDEYLKLLARCKDKGIKIIGFDSNEFPSELYRDDIEEYNRTKKHFLKEISKLPQDIAKEKIAESYTDILSISSSEDLLHKGSSIEGNPIGILGYYAERDQDTAEGIRKRAKRSKGAIMYFCNVTHFNPNYKHLEFLLKDLEPEIVSIYGAKNSELQTPKIHL